MPLETGDGQMSSQVTSGLSRELIFLVLQFLDEEGLSTTLHACVLINLSVICMLTKEFLSPRRPLSNN
jgi:hypothetical protein